MSSAAEERALLVPEGLAGERVDTGLARMFGISRSKAADRGVDGALEGVGVTLHERVVDLVDRTVPEGILEHRVGVLGLADHHHA